MPVVTSPSADATSITIRWQRPEPPNDVTVAYHIYFFIVSRESETSQMLNVVANLNQTVLSQVLTGLEPYSNYSVQVSRRAEIWSGRFVGTLRKSCLLKVWL